MESNGLVATEEKEVRPECRGNKEQLLIDKTVCSDSKEGRTNMAMAWIDNLNAYDSVAQYTTTIIDETVPLDWKVKEKDDEKILKY